VAVTDEAGRVVDAGTGGGRVGPRLHVLLDVKAAGATGEADPGGAGAHDLSDVDGLRRGGKRGTRVQVGNGRTQASAVIGDGSLEHVPRRGLGAGVEIDGAGGHLSQEVPVLPEPDLTVGVRAERHGHALADALVAEGTAAAA